MQNGKWAAIPLLFLIVFSLCSCGVTDDTGIIKNLLKNNSLEPSYADSTDMNNYLRGMRGYTGRPTFVFDGQNVRFEDVANYYTLKDGENFVTYLPRQVTRYETTDEVESVTHGIIVDGALYNGQRSIVYSSNKENEIVAWQIAIKKENDDTLYVVNSILPYAGNFYFIQDGSLYRCKGKELEYVETGGKEKLFQTENAEQVFSTIDVRWFGIFSDTAIVIGDTDQIWTIDLLSNEAVCVFEGNEFYDGGCCVSDGYIYYVVDCGEHGRGSLERVKFDGTGRETDLLTINSDVLQDYVFNIADGNFYFLQYSKLNDEYFLCAAPLSNLSAQITLAHGPSHGIDEWESELYPNGEWIYYATKSMGFWRAKTDGTLVEKIQEFNSENVGENMNSLSVDVTEMVSDFVFEQYELSPESNPDMVGGYCGAEIDGKNASWKLENGVLTISGYGDMMDMDGYDDQPWSNVRFDVTSIVVEDGITSLGSECFKDLSNVTNVSLPNSLERIGKRSFLFTSLETIQLPSNLIYIGEEAFCNLSTLSGELNLPDSITEIDRAAFYGCTGFTGKLSLPSSLCTIGEMAFKDCYGFTGDLTIPGGVVTISEGAFAHCSQISGTLTLSEGVKCVEQNAFIECSQIGTIDIPSTMEKVESTAFNKCQSVQTIVYHGSKNFDGNLYLPKAVFVNAG